MAAADGADGDAIEAAGGRGVPTARETDPAEPCTYILPITSEVGVRVALLLT
jgi:hypothetical protein